MPPVPHQRVAWSRVHTVCAGLSVALALLLSAWFAPSLSAVPPGAAKAPTTQKSAAPPRPITVKGRVLDAQGEPVVGATIRPRGGSSVHRSDGQGQFQLRVPSAKSEVAIHKEGFLIAGFTADRPPGDVKLEPLPQKDNPAYAWVSPHPDPADEARCGNCHQHIYNEWAGSSHARSATNRRFLSLLHGTDWNGKPDVGWSVQRGNPHGVGVCTSCHAPTVKPTEPAFMDLSQVQGVAAAGVHCDLCHKIQGTTTADKFGITHGINGLDLLRPSTGQLFFGPWDDVTRGEDAFSPLYNESRYCATCHEGTVFGQKVYTTYSEWLASPAKAAGKQCQDCHMQSTGNHTNVAPGHGGLERPADTLSRHDFPGGETGLLRKGLTLTAEIQRKPITAENDQWLALELSAAGVGHAVPTGSADRNLLLVVEPYDATGKLLEVEPEHRPGWDASEKLVGPELAGKAAQVFAKIWATRTEAPVPFWERGSWMADNRLLPDKPEQGGVVLPRQTASVRIRVIYRRFWPAMEKEKGWPQQEILVIDRWVKSPPAKDLEAEKK